MFSIRKEHDFLVCIDSDGTVMDTMVSKHRYAMGPAFIETFGIKNHQEEILNEWVERNCFSPMRGYNRFLTLGSMLRSVRKYGYEFYGLEEYLQWMNHTSSLSIPSLEQELKIVSNDNVLKLAITWAELSNQKISELPPPSPFSSASPAIHEIYKKADLLGVSTANSKALNSEWTSAGVIDCFKVVASQEYGTKETILRTALSVGYRPDHVIMIGDSYGDYQAAVSAGILFYPMLPNHENESWKDFTEHAFVKFISSRYDTAYQEKLMKKYMDSLHN